MQVKDIQVKRCILRRQPLNKSIVFSNKKHSLKNLSFQVFHPFAPLSIKYLVHKAIVSTMMDTTICSCSGNFHSKRIT